MHDLRIVFITMFRNKTDLIPLFNTFQHLTSDLSSMAESIEDERRGRDRMVSSRFYNYLCNQCLSPLKLWVRIPIRRGELDTSLCDKVCHWLATGRWLSPGTPVSSTYKTDRHDKTEILLKVAFNTITLHRPQFIVMWCFILYVECFHLYMWCFVFNLYAFIWAFPFSLTMVLLSLYAMLFFYMRCIRF